VTKKNNKGEHQMTQFRMFSDPALRRFKQFCDEAVRPTKDPRAHQGAHDIKQVFGVVQPLTPWPKRHRGLGSDAQAREIVEANSARRDPRDMGRTKQPTYSGEDEMEGAVVAEDVSEPDRDSVRSVLACIDESLGHEAAAEVMRVLHLKWEGVAGEQPGLDGETRADRVTGDDEPEDEDATVATSAWPGAVRQRKMDKPVNEFAHRGANDLPPPFKGRPTPGGHLVGDAALKRYHDRFPNAARLDGTSTYVRPRGRAASMAMDAARAAAADGFSRRFPDAMKIGLDPIQYKRG